MNLRPKQAGFPLLSFLWSGLFLAMFLAPVFMVAGWFQLLGADSPDVPDPSWTDLITAPFVFCCGFPANTLLKQPSPIYAGLFDSVFWGFLCVFLYRARLFLKRHSEAKHHLKAAVMILFSFLVVYVLSVGPTLKIIWILGLQDNPNVNHIGEVIYAPLTYIHQSNETARWALETYLGLWGIK